MELVTVRTACPERSFYFNQLIVFNVHNVKGMVLSQEILEKVVEKKGNLSGATLQSDVNVKDLKFAFVKMDKTMLLLLIQKGADVRGVDLRKQNLQEIDLSSVDLSNADLSNADLSHADCTKTIFRSAILANACLDFATLSNTDFTGVDLNDTSLRYASVSSVIVSEADRIPYVEQAKSRLLFILTGEKTDGYHADRFLKLSPTEIEEIRSTILFTLDDKSWKEGKTSENKGPQDIVWDGKLDSRIVKTLACDKSSGIVEQSRTSDCATFAIKRLLGDGFSDEQKTLFHHARSAVDTILKLPTLMASNELLTTDEHLNHSLFDKIYIEGGQSEARVVPLMMKECFDAVLTHFLQDFPTISETKIGEVRHLFQSTDYCW